MLELTVMSAVFAMGADIPPRYTCTGEDVSPPITWQAVPEGTRSIALICDDPDAPVGIWTHWVIFNIPADKTTLPEAVSPDARLPDGSIQGINDFHRHGYGGPCPPPGKPHRYFFRVYALDTMLNLPASTTRSQLLAAMEGHILAKGELMGRFQR